MTDEGEEPRRGTLLPPVAAPATGERTVPVLALRNLVVEQILSGAGDVPVEYLQNHDEWVIVLAGAAGLDVGGEEIELRPGDWAFLPGGVPHRLLRTSAGTSWLAVHLDDP